MRDSLYLTSLLVVRHGMIERLNFVIVPTTLVEIYFMLELPLDRVLTLTLDRISRAIVGDMMVWFFVNNVMGLFVSYMVIARFLNVVPWLFLFVVRPFLIVMSLLFEVAWLLILVILFVLSDVRLFLLMNNMCGVIAEDMPLRFVTSAMGILEDTVDVVMSV